MRLDQLTKAELSAEQDALYDALIGGLLGGTRSAAVITDDAGIRAGAVHGDAAPSDRRAPGAGPRRGAAVPRLALGPRARARDPRRRRALAERLRVVGPRAHRTQRGPHRRRDRRAAHRRAACTVDDARRPGRARRRARVGAARPISTTPSTHACRRSSATSSSSKSPRSSATTRCSRCRCGCSASPRPSPSRFAVAAIAGHVRAPSGRGQVAGQVRAWSLNCVS